MSTFDDISTLSQLSDPFKQLYNFRETAQSFLEKDSTQRYPRLNSRLTPFIVQVLPNNATVQQRQEALNRLNSYEGSSAAIRILGAYDRLYDILQTEASQITTANLNSLVQIIDQMSGKSPSRSYTGTKILDVVYSGFGQDVTGILLWPFCKMLKNVYNRVDRINSSSSPAQQVYKSASMSAGPPQGLANFCKQIYNELMPILEMYDVNNRYSQAGASNNYSLLPENKSFDKESIQAILNNIFLDFKTLETILLKTIEVDIKLIELILNYSSKNVLQKYTNKFPKSNINTLKKYKSYKVPQKDVVDDNIQYDFGGSTQEIALEESLLYKNILKKLLKYSK